MLNNPFLRIMANAAQNTNIRQNIKPIMTLLFI